MPERFKIDPPTKCQLCRNKSQNIERPPVPNAVFWFCQRCVRDFDEGMELRTMRVISRSVGKKAGYHFTEADRALLLAHQKLMWKIETHLMTLSMDRVLGLNL